MKIVKIFKFEELGNDEGFVLFAVENFSGVHFNLIFIFLNKFLCYEKF
jgi:hypothetical protein